MTADEWNARYPVGTWVEFWPGSRSGVGFTSTTRSPAWPLGDGTPVVSIDGVSGDIWLAHVQPIHDAQEVRDA